MCNGESVMRRAICGWQMIIFNKFCGEVEPKQKTLLLWVVNLLQFCTGGEKFRGLPFTHCQLTFWARL